MNDKEDEYEDVVKDQKDHFKELYEKNRGEPEAVASETYEHKNLRYSKLSEIFPDNGRFTVYEVGYGLGHFFCI